MQLRTRRDCTAASTTTPSRVANSIPTSLCQAIQGNTLQCKRVLGCAMLDECLENPLSDCSGLQNPSSGRSHSPQLWPSGLFNRASTASSTAWQPLKTTGYAPAGLTRQSIVCGTSIVRVKILGNPKVHHLSRQLRQLLAAMLWESHARLYLAKLQHHTRPKAQLSS